MTADYLPAEMRTASASAKAAEARSNPAPFITRATTRILGWLTRAPSKVHGHSLRNADVASQQRSYPIAIMRAGASAEVTNYTTLAEDLASHGYVVVAFDAPYRTGRVVFPDGRVISRTPENNPELCFGRQDQEQCLSCLLAAWTADIAFVLDRLEKLNAPDPRFDQSGKFTGRLNTNRVGIFGHSFGGAAAAQFCSEDPRCKAGIDVDGTLHGPVIHAGIHVPFMFLLSDHSYESDDPETAKILADIQSIYDRLPSDGKLRIVIRGANHFVFTDDGALFKSRAVRWALRARHRLGIDGPRQLAVTSYCIRSFFDTYLKGASSAPLKISSPLYPEIQILE
jgi:predicted dienelactone hydrolase